jgi:acetylornithine/succinyldiaminopimelate/putrescine aminotransferase
MHLGHTNYDLAIEAVRTLNRDRKCTFFMPSRFMSAEAALVGASINELLAGILAPRGDWRLFFANSHDEALQGALKLIRHYCALNGLAGREIWIFGAPESLIFNDGLNAVPSALPGFRVIGLGAIREWLTGARLPPAGIVLTSHAARLISTQPGLADVVRNMPGLLVSDWDDAPSDVNFKAVHGAAKLVPDVVLFGESLTRGAVPFGAFAMSPRAYEPWSRFATGFTHSSTFGGNRLALRLVLHELLSAEQRGQRLALYSNDKSLREDHYSRYVNPSLQSLYELIDCDIPNEAAGSTLKLPAKLCAAENCLDAVTGAGAAVRGHCPPDIESAVLDVFDPKTDYWQLLELELQRATGMQSALPAVSGASAAETAILLALSATGRRRVVTFTRNFSGRTLLALALSAIDEIQAPFRPLYPDVVHIDPLQPDATAKFSAAVTNDTAVVWFEYVRGADGLVIPPPLCQAIRDGQRRHGYLIGIDEVLAGLFRTGRVTSASIAFPDPDLIILSKSLSDGTFPVGVTLAARTVLDAAERRAPRLVSALKQRYRNQLAAAIAVNCLRKLLDPALSANVEVAGSRLSECLSRITGSSTWLTRFHQAGLLIMLEYDSSHPLLQTGHSELNEMAVILAFADRMTKCGLLPYMDQLTPPLTITPREIDAMILALETAFLCNPEAVIDEVLRKRAKLAEINAADADHPTPASAAKFGANVAPSQPIIQRGALDHAAG